LNQSSNNQSSDLLDTAGNGMNTSNSSSNNASSSTLVLGESHCNRLFYERGVFINDARAKAATSSTSAAAASDARSSSGFGTDGDSTAEVAESSLDDGQHQGQQHLQQQQRRKRPSLQLYVCLIRSCRVGHCLDEAQFYFHEYHQLLSLYLNATALAATTTSHHLQQHHQQQQQVSQPLNLQNKSDEMLTFALLSVLQGGKGYRRICELGRALIDSAIAGATATASSSESSPLPTAAASGQSCAASPLPDAAVDAISASVLATVAQAASEAHDAALVSQCLAFILRKFASSSSSSSKTTAASSPSSSSEHNGELSASSSSSREVPSTFALFQALSAASKTGAVGFPELAEACIRHGWVTAESPSDAAAANINKNNSNNNRSSAVPTAQSPRTASSSQLDGVGEDDDEATLDLAEHNNNNNNNISGGSRRAGSGDGVDDESDEADEHSAIMASSPSLSARSGAASNSATNPPKSLFDARRDVRLHLLLQWTMNSAAVHEESAKLLAELEGEVRAARRKERELNNNGSSNNNKSASLAADVLSERCANQVLQLLHRIEHADYARWYRLARSLGYFRRQWVEMLVLWADRRRYALRREEREYVLEQFRAAGASQAGLRPMLALLRFDAEHQPLEQFKQSGGGVVVPEHVAPTVLDPRVHFLRRGANRVLSLSGGGGAGAATSSLHDAVAPIAVRAALPLSYQEAPPVLHDGFRAAVAASVVRDPWRSRIVIRARSRATSSEARGAGSAFAGYKALGACG
jgi:hypothetical protein